MPSWTDEQKPPDMTTLVAQIMLTVPWNRLEIDGDIL